MRFKSRFANSLAQGLSGKNEQPVRPPWRGPIAAGLRPALASESENLKAKWFQPRIPS